MDLPAQRHCGFQAQYGKENSLRFNPCDVRFNGPTQRHAGTIEQGGQYVLGSIGGKFRLFTTHAKSNAEKIYLANGIVAAFLNQKDFGPGRISEDNWSNSRPFLTAPIGLARSWQILDPINVARCKGSCFIVDRIF